MKFPSHLTKLIEVLKKLPGVGNKSAERFAFQLISWNKSELNEMASVIHDITTKIHQCAQCGCLADTTSCRFCDDSRMTFGVICVIASPRDAFALEETREFKGSYHVLGALLSPMDGRGPDALQLPKLRERILKHQIKELVIALDSTLEGDATSLYLKRELSDLPLNISRLAFGLPMGSSLDFVDGGTLARAFTGRAPF